MTKMSILDIDDALTWEETYSRFLRCDSSWGFIEHALLQDSDDKIHEVFQGLQNRIDYVQSPELLSLRSSCPAYFRDRFTHVAAYHACRPTNIDAYMCAGIAPANTAELIEKARAFFNNADAVDNALREIGTDYLNHGRERIGFFISRTGSLESGYSHYLRYGSELFQCIASRLGEWAVQRISNLGTPTLFRCALPISWLDEFTTFPVSDSYALEPIIQLLVRLRWPKKEDSTIRGAFLLTRSLPKEYILEHIDMTPFMKETDEV